MKVIASYTVEVSVELLDDSALPELEVGNNYAKLGTWNAAIAQYNAALSRADRNPEIAPKIRAKALYDLGIGFGYSGRYEEGVSRLEQAFSLEPDDAFRQQIERIKQFKADDQKLAEQQAGAAGGRQHTDAGPRKD
jgi:tetratricopeptide (TPR) repeat protein